MTPNERRGLVFYSLTAASTTPPRLKNSVIIVPISHMHSYLRVSFLTLIVGLSIAEAVVHTGTMSMPIRYEFDFSEAGLPQDPSDTDLFMGQLFESHPGGFDAIGPARFRSIDLLVDLGPRDFDEFTHVPAGIKGDSTTAIYINERLSYWSAEIHQGHLYIVQTREKHFVKFSVEEVILFEDSIYAVREIKIRWAYQDDGSTSFLPLPTAVRARHWARVKQGEAANQSTDEGQ